MSENDTVTLVLAVIMAAEFVVVAILIAAHELADQFSAALAPVFDVVARPIAAAIRFTERTMAALADLLRRGSG